MFKNVLKNIIIPITIVALILVVSISLFFKESSAYKKKTIVNTYQSKEADKTITSDGEGCKKRFDWLGFNVYAEKQESGKITFTISSKTKHDDYTKLLKQSGYSGSITYKYVIKQKKNGKFVTVKSDVVTIDNKKYTSKVVSDEYSSNGVYEIYIYTQEWIRDKECEGGKGPDEGYCTCNPGKLYKKYSFYRENYRGDEQYQLQDETIEYHGEVEVERSDDKTPAGQGENVHVNNYTVNSDCKLPENSQANTYLLHNTDKYDATKNDSATFKKYSDEFNNAPADKKEEVTVTGSSVGSKVISLTCDYNLDINDIKSVANSDNVAYSGSKLNYYKYDVSNTHYYKGVKTEKHYVPDYVWHTTLGKTTNNSDNYCTRTCTEIVKVEYGSPAYVTAGMCFQYRMKVSSIVQCKYDDAHMKVPSKKATLCQPVAFCIHGSYTSYGAGGSTQAGPNEDFEACINKCDGGKYSAECSNACYNLVYNNKYSNDLVLSNSTKPTKTSTTVNGFTTFFAYRNGSIQFDHDGSIVSAGTSIGKTGDLGTATGFSMKGYVVKALSSSSYWIRGGIPRAYYGNGETCHEQCGWVPGKGCSDPHEYYFDGDTYYGKFGEKVFAKDYADNVEKYNATLRECKAKATCVSSTATYTIKVKYVESGESELKVSEAVYPWTSSKKTETKSPSNSCILSMANRNPVISFGGCYVNSSAERWYQGEMTFPGVYLDYKHNIIKIDGSAENHDILLPGRMCINGYQGNTNAAWAAKFDAAIGQLNKNPNYKIENVGEYWRNTFKETSYDADKNSVEGYNIKGIIRDFGYFKWNFNISCFYALYVPCDTSQPEVPEILCKPNCEKDGNSGSGTASTKECYDPETAAGKAFCQNATCPPDDSYTVRSYNASDPLVTGTSSRESDDVQYKETDIRGYNWTSAATLTKMTSGYNNDPEKLIDDIVQNQNTIFDNNVNKPNYVIVLDKDTIKNIKRHNKNDKTNPYSTFNDKRPVDSNRINAGGVYFYYSSDFLHNSSIFTSSSNVIPNSPSADIYNCNYYTNGACKSLVGGE